MSLDKLWYMQKYHAKLRIEKAASGGDRGPFDTLSGFVMRQVRQDIDQSVL